MITLKSNKYCLLLNSSVFDVILKLRESQDLLGMFSQHFVVSNQLWMSSVSVIVEGSNHKVNPAKVSREEARGTLLQLILENGEDLLGIWNVEIDVELVLKRKGKIKVFVLILKQVLTKT